MSRRCKNCGHWATTDRASGECYLASNRVTEQRAQAVLVEFGEERQATLETMWDFGCVAWVSCRTIKHIGAAA